MTITRLYLVILAIAAVFVWASFALAHDSEHPELNGWYMGLQSRSKAPCCDGSDATHLADPDWESRDGHYRVRIENQWIDVPDSAIVDGPNRDGRAMVWPYPVWMGGEHTYGIRCFMPGTMS